jgi:L-threonylcarbamoyladenylate synthase
MMSGEFARALESAARVLREGGIVAYPTEAVYGLGCDPRNGDACARLFLLKDRPPGHGVLLIGADFEQVAPYLDLAATPVAALERAQATWPGAHSWILPRAANAPAWLGGEHTGIGVRVTAHPPAAALCGAFGAALVSTSANRHGEPPTRSAGEVRDAFGNAVEILDAPLGGLDRPTPIRDAISGKTLRN